VEDTPVSVSRLAFNSVDLHLATLHSPLLLFLNVVSMSCRYGVVLRCIFMQVASCVNLCLYLLHSRLLTAVEVVQPTSKTGDLHVAALFFVPTSACTAVAHLVSG
jgi:hypothetical protein